jgi:hypothetical protein
MSIPTARLWSNKDKWVSVYNVFQQQESNKATGGIESWEYNIKWNAQYFLSNLLSHTIYLQKQQIKSYFHIF